MTPHQLEEAIKAIRRKIKCIECNPSSGETPDLTELIQRVDDLEDALELAEIDIVNIESDIDTIENDIDSINTTLELKADLVLGVVPLNQLPVQALIPNVNTYADLPLASTVTGQKYGVLNSQGTSWLPGSLGGTYYSKGYYYSDGVIWIYMGSFPFQASQADVNAGVIIDQFVSPNTLANSTLLLRPEGLNGEVQFKNGSELNGANNVLIDSSGNLNLKVLSAKPTGPASGNLQIFSRNIAGQAYIDVQRTSGRDFPLQPHFGVNRIGTWAPSATTTVVTQGIPRTAVGTVSHPALATGGLANQMRRWRITSGGSANSVADERTATTVCWRGNDVGLGGFTFITRINMSVIPALSRCFFGLHTSTGALSTTQDPQALTNVIGIGFNQGVDTNWQILRNDGSGVCEKTDLGISFPASSLTNVLTLYISCTPNANSVFVSIVQEVLGVIVENEFSTEIPGVTQFLAVRQYMNNGGTAAACSFDCSGVYLETDY